jgi:hypothetical protein
MRQVESIAHGRLASAVRTDEDSESTWKVNFHRRRNGCAKAIDVDAT